MQEDVYAGLLDHFDHQILHRFGIDGRIDARPAVDDRAVELVEPPHHLFADALADLLAALDDVPGDDEHESAGPQAAEVAVTLDERHVGPGPFRGDRGGDARRAGAEHQHVGLVQDGKLAAAVGSPCRRRSRGTPDRASTSWPAITWL